MVARLGARAFSLGSFSPQSNDRAWNLIDASFTSEARIALQAGRPSRATNILMS